MPIKTGATVRQIQPAPITGVVIERRFNDSHDQMEYHVESPTDADGDGVGDRHWFLESQIAAVPPAADAQVINASDVGDLSAVLGTTGDAA